MAPGPASSGNASGTTPTCAESIASSDSSGVFFTRDMRASSIWKAIDSSSKPPATRKPSMLMLNNSRICVPPSDGDGEDAGHGECRRARDALALAC